MGPLRIPVIHSITETDFGPYHSWQCPLDPSAHNTREHAMRNARQIAKELQADHIDSTIEISTYKIPFPREW